MKRNISAAILLLAVFVYSCTTKENSFLETTASSATDIDLVDDGSIVYEPAVEVEDFILDNEAEPDTKTVLSFDSSAAHFTFTTGDRIGVFPYNVSGAPQMPFILKSSDAQSCYFNCPGFSLKSGVRYAAYYPYNPTDMLSYTAVPVNYTGQTQTTAKAPGASDASFNISGADYLLAQATPENNACSFKMSHIGALVVMDVTVGQSATYTEISLNSSSASFIQTGTLNVGQSFTLGDRSHPTQGIAINGTPTSNKMTLTLGSGSGIYLTAGSTYRFCMMVPPTNVTGTVTIRLKDSSGVEHIAYVGTKNLLQGYAYRYTCTVDAQTNLSEVSMANSYIVNTSSIDSDGYFFPTIQCGNGRAVDWASIGFTDGEGEAYPTGGGVSLSGNGVKWKGTNSNWLNQNNCISDVFFANNRIYFKASGAKGNAKVTLTNNGTEVWTWHIWCTDQPGTISIKSKTSGNTYSVMDRNMGAITNGATNLEIVSEGEECAGLYYPFGFPFGYTVSEYSNGDEGGWRMIDAYAFSPTRPILKYSGQYMSFNSWGASDYQLPWCLLWGGGSSYYYNNFTSKIGNVNTKTMYDPCPPGYKVMTYDVLDGYATNWGSSPTSGLSANYYGISISGTNGTLFIPYNGTVYQGGVRTFGVTIWGSGYTVSTMGWKVNLWTSRYWQSLMPTAYAIQRRPRDSSDNTNNYAINGGLKQAGGEDGITIGHGVRCMVGW